MQDNEAVQPKPQPSAVTGMRWMWNEDKHNPTHHPLRAREGECDDRAKKGRGRSE